MVCGKRRSISRAAVLSSIRSDCVLLVLSKLSVVLLEYLCHLEVVLGLGVRFLIQSNWPSDVVVDVALNVCELYWRIRWVTLEDDLVVVSALDKLAEVILLIDVMGVLHGELGQSLFKVRMESSRID